MERLHEAARHHARANAYTRQRIQREMRRLWDLGAAIGLLKPGYLRKATFPATLREPEQGPFYDEVDPRWAPVILEAFERIAGGEVPALVADWLTERGLPKTQNSRTPHWTENNVKDLIKRPDYGGRQEHRRTVSRKQHATGKRVCKRNDEDEVWVREMPHLRIIPDDLQARAIAAIKSRDRGDGYRGDKPNPHAGVPRDSRGLLSGLFFCSRCGSKMYVISNYRCGGALKKKACWNKARALCDLTQETIVASILGEFPSARMQIEQRLREVAERLGDERHREQRRADLTKKITDCREVVNRLLAAIETGKSQEETPESLVKRLSEREEELATAIAELKLLDRQAQLPSLSDVDQRMDEIRAGILTMDRGARDILAQVVPRIEAVPCLQFGSNKVVLRARFEIRVAGFLPPRTVWPLDGLTGIPLEELFGTIPVEVDLFKPSAGPAYWSQALDLADQGKGLSEIGRLLGIGKRRAHLAKQYGVALRAAGLSDPFVELFEEPNSGSRWRSRRRPAEELGTP